MSGSSTMRQIGTKTVGFKIELMKWSNRMDLLAFSNDKGEIIVKRLNWQKVLTHPPPCDGIKVRGLDWRPDEKVIAIGYSNGRVVLFNIENQQEIHSFDLNEDISYLGWTQNSIESVHGDIENALDSHETFLPPLPSFNSLSLTPRQPDNTIAQSYSKNILNLLLVGLKSGILHTSVFGVLPCGQIDVCKTLNELPTDFEIIDAKMSVDFRQTFVFVNVKQIVKVLVFENEIFPKYSGPLLNLATRHGYILNTLAYMDDIIHCITEAWETALLQMDYKLTAYAKTQPPGTVSADFLELLMFGYPSDSLAQFLTKDLTEKGLKRLGNSIEVSYSTIMLLVIKPLHSSIMNVFYHLNCIKGMSRNSYHYKPLLGTLSNNPIENVGAFIIKSIELQMVIEQSMRDYKIFWSWLYTVQFRLMEEAVPDDIAAVSQQDIMYLAEFLNNFDPCDVDGDEESTNASPKKFNLERVGQYLANKNLECPPNIDGNSKWEQLLEENECLRKSPVIYPHNRELSLVQQYSQMKDSINELFLKPEKLIGEKFHLKTIIQCLDCREFSDRPIYTSQTNIDKVQISIFCGMISKGIMFYVEWNPNTSEISTIKLEFGHKPFFVEKLNNFGDLSFRHVQFYNEEILSILLDNSIEDRVSNCFLQFPVVQLRTRLISVPAGDSIDLIEHVPVTNIFEIIDTSLIKNIDGFDVGCLCVSGSRKVASLLSESQKRIRLYEMEVEEDDEDLDISQNNSLDISKGSNK